MWYFKHPHMSVLQEAASMAVVVGECDDAMKAEPRGRAGQRVQPG